MRKDRVLLVEVDQETLDLQEILLRSVGGYEVDRATSVGAAIALFGSRAPDLVLLDIAMPLQDGWYFVESPIVQASAVPIVVLSGLANVRLSVSARRRLSGYITKPFEIPKLLSGCAHVLRARRPANGDTRREERTTYLLDASVRCAGLALKGQLHDIAEGGFGIHCDGPLRVGETVSSHVHVPWRRAPVELSGRVRWRNIQLHGVQSTWPIAWEAMLFGGIAGHA